MTLGGSNPRSDKSNPTGDMTPARSETAAKVLFAFPNQMDGGRHLRVAEVEPRLLVVVVGLGVAGVDDGELGCGGRSSGAVGISVAGGLGRRWCVLRAPGDVWSTMASSVGRYGDRGHDGDIAGGVELSARWG